MRPGLVLLMGVFSALGATVFVPPDETRILFRRDLLPVDPDTMRVLSELLSQLAQRGTADDPAQARATAQLLALATRLDPANRAARDLGRRLAENEAPPAPEGRVLNRALAETWHIVSWLLDEKAGAEGNRLGNQLVDALRVIDPQHPAADRHDGPGEAARWKGVVVPVERFVRPAVPEAPEPAPSPEPSPLVEPANPPPAEAAATFQLSQAAVLTPIYTYGRNYDLHLGVVPVTMTIQDDDDAGALKLALLPAFESPLMESMAISAGISLRQWWPGLPRRKRAVFLTNDERYASRNGAALSGPMTLLLQAGLSGTTLREDLHFLGEIDSRGKLVTPERGWDLLRGLRRGEGGRLVVPSGFRRELEALLVLGEPEFFIKYEVLAAASLDAALALGAADESPEAVREASALFDTVQGAAAKTPVGQLAANTIFRARLDGILSRMPDHLSASMLRLQGSNERPKRLDPVIFAHDLRHTLEGIGWVARSDVRTIEPARLEAAWAAARRDLAKIEKLIARRDLPLHEAAVAVVDRLRTMARSRRLDVKGKSAAREEQLYKEHLALRDGLDRLRVALAPRTGEAVPEEPAPTAPPIAPEKRDKVRPKKP